MSKHIGFIGTGKMASALISFISKSKFSIIASNRTKEKLIEIKKRFGIKIAKNNIDVVKNSYIVFICVKPRDIDNVLDEIKNFVRNKIIVSIAAGIKTNYIESKLKNAKVIRVMPNLACIVGEMAAGICAGKYATKSEINAINDILSPAGKLFVVNEDLMDIVTALAGSGPAFFAYLIKAFWEAGIKNGLDDETANKIALQTALGTVRLMIEKNIRAKELIEMVASPKGTTMAGLEVLNKFNAKEILEKTIEAAIKRSKELSKLI